MPVVATLDGSTTVNKIIEHAMRDAGVLGNGQTLSANDADIAFETLMQMLALWRTDDLEVYAHRNITVPMTGAITYTIGIGADVDVDRPTAILQAIYNDTPNTTSYPLAILNTLEDWQRIAVKSLPGNIPDAVLYEPTNEQGTLYVWPQPAAGEIQLTVRTPFPIYTTIADELGLPPEYQAPVRFNLAKWLCASFGAPLRPDIAQLAKGTLKQLKAVNTRIRQLEMPDRMPMGKMDRGFNIFTDRP